MTDFFIRREADLDRAVFDLWVVNQVCNCCDDLCDTGFIIRPQQGGTVGCNQGFANVFFQVREFLWSGPGIPLVT